MLSLGIEPMILALLAPCSTIWATGKTNSLCVQTHLAIKLFLILILIVIQLGKTGSGRVSQTKTQTDIPARNAHFQRRITDCGIVFQINKYVNLACFLNICKHIMVFLCFSRVKNLHTAPLILCSFFKQPNWTIPLKFQQLNNKSHFQKYNLKQISWTHKCLILSVRQVKTKNNQV